MPGKPAVRVGDQCAHGGVITGPGVPTVLIGGMPAAVMGDMHACPMVNPAPPAIPHVGATIIATGVMVLIGGKPAAVMGDMAVCTGPPDSIVAGCPTVLIGSGGGGGGGGGGAGKSAKAKARVAESEVKEGHYLDVKFQDKGGKPITGLNYVVKDPDSRQTGGVLTGQVKKSGLKEGNCEIELKAIIKAEWSAASAKAGEKVKLKAQTGGIKDGVKAEFRIFIRDSNYADRQLTAVESEISGNKAEAEWQLEVDKELLKIQADKENIGRFSSPVYYFYIEADGVQSRSPFLSVVDTFEARVVDDEGQPMKNKDYLLFLPTGEVRDGTLDGDGKVKLENVPPGRVKLRVNVRE